MEIPDYLFEQQKRHTEAVAIERRLKSAVFNVKKKLDGFDFEFQRSIDKKVIEDLATLRFVYYTENVVLPFLPKLESLTSQLLLGLKWQKQGFLFTLPIPETLSRD